VGEYGVRGRGVTPCRGGGTVGAPAAKRLGRGPRTATWVGSDLRLASAAFLAQCDDWVSRGAHLTRILLL
jgi:hypothetical protein